ncbi:MAG TPA: hypothetical protein VIR58_06745 [Acidimicrobiales bacterium]
MRKSITAAAVAASLTVGGLSGAALGTPSLAGASDAERSGWVEDALEPLVADGTITADQADAVEDALQDARPERRGPGPGLEAAAEALGMTDDELRDALHDGQTIAELADAAGVDLEGIVDALVAAHQEHLAEAVADGHLSQEQADEIAADLDERVAAMIDGERPDRPFAGRRGPR